MQVLKAKSLCLLKPKSSDFEVTSNDKSDCDHKDEVMEALDKIGAIGEQLNTILDRLNKLDVIETSIKNIETNLANLKVRTAKLEDFEAGARKDIEDLKKSCSFNGNNLKEYKENVKKILDEQNQKFNHKIDDLISKNLYLESYSRRENIKFFNISENSDEVTEETLRNFMEQELGFRNACSLEIQRVHRLNRRNDTDPRPIIARFPRYKDVEEIFALGRRLEGTNFQMFRDRPQEIIKRRKDQMAVLKKARRNGMRASFSRSQADKLYINGDFWPVGKALEGDE